VLELVPDLVDAATKLLHRAAVVDDDVRPGQAFLRLQLGRRVDEVWEELQRLLEQCRRMPGGDRDP